MKAAAAHKRMLNAAEVAERLGRSRSWFYQNRGELERAGFPCRHPILRLWDAKAIDAWLDGSMDDRDAKRLELDAAFGI